MCFSPQVANFVPSPEKHPERGTLSSLFSVSLFSLSQSQTNNPLSFSSPIDTKYLPFGEKNSIFKPYRCPPSYFNGLSVSDGFEGAERSHMVISGFLQDPSPVASS